MYYIIKTVIQDIWFVLGGLFVMSCFTALYIRHRQVKPDFLSHCHLVADNIILLELFIIVVDQIKINFLIPCPIRTSWSPSQRMLTFLQPDGNAMWCRMWFPFMTFSDLVRSLFYAQLHLVDLLFSVNWQFWSNSYQFSSWFLIPMTLFFIVP